MAAHAHSGLSVVLSQCVDALESRKANPGGLRDVPHSLGKSKYQKVKIAAFISVAWNWFEFCSCGAAR